jgi:hypothetical protein
MTQSSSRTLGEGPRRICEAENPAKPVRVREPEISSRLVMEPPTAGELVPPVIAKEPLMKRMESHESNEAMPGEVGSPVSEREDWASRPAKEIEEWLAHVSAAVVRAVNEELPEKARVIALLSSWKGMSAVRETESSSTSIAESVRNIEEVVDVPVTIRWVTAGVEALPQVTVFETTLSGPEERSQVAVIEKATV